MTLLLHAISATPAISGIAATAEAPTAEAPTSPAPGQALVFVELGRIGVWASREGAVDGPLEHHRVVEAICDRRHCLPLRFGTRVADEAAARALLEGSEDRLVDLLQRVGGRRELALTLLWTDRAPTIAVPGGAGGRAYLEARRARHTAADERWRRAEDLAGAIDAALATDAADRRHAFCPAAEVALSTSILAPSGEAEAMKERVLRIARDLPGVRAVVSGPWPPYTFAGQG